MKKEEQNREYVDRIDLKSELGEIVYNYSKKHGENTNLRIERRKRTKNVWQLVETNTNNILWKGNERDMLGGVARYNLLQIERKVADIIEGIDTNGSESIQIEIIGVNKN